MLHRLNQEGRLTLVVAQKEAFQLKHPQVTPIHLLLALLNPDVSGESASLLRRAGINRERVMEEVALIATTSGSATQVKYSTEAEAAVRAAGSRRAENEMVGAVDLLAALLDHQGEILGRAIVGIEDSAHDLSRDSFGASSNRMRSPMDDRPLGGSSVPIWVDTEEDQ
jgi:ATP-dependent Clp protease ATP-binding subunit ClpA